jgi:hypothetical protein
MNEQERQAALERLYNPQMPDPFIAHDFGVLYRDLPPRRTLRERFRTLLWWRHVEDDPSSYAAAGSQPGTGGDPSRL